MALNDFFCSALLKAFITSISPFQLLDFSKCFSHIPILFIQTAWAGDFRPFYKEFNSSLGLLITSKFFLMKLLPAGFCFIVTDRNGSSYTSYSFLRQKKTILISSIGWCLGHSQALTGIYIHDSSALAECWGGEGDVLKVKKTTKVWGMIRFFEEGCRADRFSEWPVRSWVQCHIRWQQDKCLIFCYPLSWMFRIAVFKSITLSLGAMYIWYWSKFYL